MTNPTRTIKPTTACELCEEKEVKSGKVCPDCLEYLEDLLEDDSEED